MIPSKITRYVPMLFAPLNAETIPLTDSSAPKTAGKKVKISANILCLL